MVKYVKKVWGKEQIICNSELYCGKILHLNKGFQCSLHRHSMKDETFYVLSGKVMIRTGVLKVKPIRVLKPGDSIHIPPYMLHQFAGVVDSRIIEFSTEHVDSDSFRITESGSYEESDWDS